MNAFRLEDLPFIERDPLELLGIDRGRVTPDLSGDFTVHGYARLREVVLGDATGARTLIRDALVLAVHTPDVDDPDADPTRFEVEFEVKLAGDPDAPGVWVFVTVDHFLDVKAPQVIGDAREIVLALCNPLDRRPAPPRWLTGARRVHFATGDVVSWLDTDHHGRERIRLQAERWHTMTAATHI